MLVLLTGRRGPSLSKGLSATSHGLGMRIGMTLVYPVQWSVAIRGAHGSNRAPARCCALSGFRLQFANLMSPYSAEEEKKTAKRDIKNTATR